MRKISFLFVFLAITLFARGQNQPKADSLKSMLHGAPEMPDSVKLSVVSQILNASSSPEELILYSDQLLKLANNVKNVTQVFRANQFKGIAFRMKGDLKKSLEYLFLSAAIASDHHEHNLQASAYLEIANTYTAGRDFGNALHYEKRAVDVIRAHGDKEKLATNLLNLGYSYYTLNKFDSALLYYNEADPIFKTISLDIGQAYVLGNRALVYWKQGNYASAEHDLLKAIDMLKPLGDEFGMADYHNQLGRLYLEQKHTEKAIVQAQQALALAQSTGLKEQIRDAFLLLSELYTIKENYQQAFNYQAKYVAYKDSIENTEKIMELANMRTTFEVNLREKEIDLLAKRQALNNVYIVITVILLVFAILLLLYFRQRFLNARLIADRERKSHDEKIEGLLNEQETRALESMIQGRDTERKHLAQELHNHLGSLLATVKVNLNAIDEAELPNYHTLTALVDQACSDVRNISHTLNMGISNNFGLVSALRELSIHLQRPGEMKVEFNAAMGDTPIGPENEILIYRVVQELVSNVLKHAEATSLSILLTCFEEENLVNILVQDNGKGFDADREPVGTGGIGLASLRKMIGARNGDIKFDSNPASGTTVNIDLPLSHR